MDIHKPKPVHSWRELVSEVGVVVIGIVIALAGEQAVEALHWHEKVAVVRETIMSELANDRARWEVDAAEAQCALVELEQIDKWALQSAKFTTSSAPPFRGNKLFLMHSANWSLAVSSQTLDHFPIQQQLALATLYDGIAHRDKDVQTSFAHFDRVKTLIPLATDAQGRRELRESLGALEGNLRDLVFNVDYMKRHFDQLGVKADRSDFAKDLEPTKCTS